MNGFFSRIAVLTLILTALFGALPSFAATTEFDEFLFRVQTAQTVVFGDGGGYEDAYQTAYRNGDLYFLISNLTDSWTQDEWGRYYTIAKWLVKHRFRVILNPVAYTADLREAVKNPRTSGIIWSGHGANDGTMNDVGEQVLPSSIFTDGKGSHFKHLVISACNGDEVLRYYDTSGIGVHYWSGTTDTQALFTYLISDRWNHDLESDLGIAL